MPNLNLAQRLQDLKDAIANNKLTPGQTVDVLENIIEDFTNNDPVAKWSTNFFGLSSQTEAVGILRDLFNVYLESDQANSKQDRSNKLFVANELEQLLCILAKQ